MKQPDRVKAAMRAGRKAYGYNLSFPSPWVIDILWKLDFDFVFIDGEHEPFGLDQLKDLCRTGERHKTDIDRQSAGHRLINPAIETAQDGEVDAR
jgi:2-keto-3-deoxy-L-rhamnonate aldolase RhmA